ncbi:MAG: hypothetical protein R3F12_11665 [Lysobacteraceae bacterium]
MIDSLVSVFATVTAAGVGVTTHVALGHDGSGSPVGFARFVTLAPAEARLTLAVTVTASEPLAGTTRPVHVVVWPAFTPPLLDDTYVRPALSVSVRSKLASVPPLFVSVIVYVSCSPSSAMPSL